MTDFMLKDISNIFERGAGFQVLQTSAKTQTAVMTLAPGESSSARANTHKKSDQVLLLVEGELVAEIGSEQRTMKKGDVCLVPAGTPHRFKNVSQTAAVTFNTYSPPEYPANEKD